MRAVDIIIRKRDKQELSREEIEFFIEGYTNGDIPDYQAAAFAMAILLNGMSARETTDLTLSLAKSGEIIDLSHVVPITVDKHSTGGVGDKTTLVVQPLVAACGLPVGKMSGRGLGFSGGTLDKIEAIPGFRTSLTTQEFIEQLRTVGLVLAGQSQGLAPADGKLYALRDVTGTVPSIPLIASSVMSKKIAAGAQAIVLDVKVGNGAFLNTIEDGKYLAQLMVSIAQQAGRRAIALLSEMDQPLGCAVGNALELIEAIDTLQGRGPKDFVEHCLVVAGYMLAMGGVVRDELLGKKMARQALNSGLGWEKFRSLVTAQGGDVRYIDRPELLPQANLIETVLAGQGGYLREIRAQVIGETTVQLGAGRLKKTDPIDPAVGIVVHHKVGDRVEIGDPLFTIHTNHSDRLGQARQQVIAAHLWSEEPVDRLPLFYGVVGDLSRN